MFCCSGRPRTYSGITPLFPSKVGRVAYYTTEQFNSQIYYFTSLMGSESPMCERASNPQVPRSERGDFASLSITQCFAARAGLKPAHLSVSDSKSDVSVNFTTLQFIFFRHKKSLNFSQSRLSNILFINK